MDNGTTVDLTKYLRVGQSCGGARSASVLRDLAQALAHRDRLRVDFQLDYGRNRRGKSAPQNRLELTCFLNGDAGRAERTGERGKVRVNEARADHPPRV